MTSLAEERRALEDGITMMRKAQLNRIPGIQEIMITLERLYDDIRSAGLQMKSARYREKLGKDCKFYCILLELVGQAIQSASDSEDLNRSLSKIYNWYKENSSQLQLTERPVFQNAQGRSVAHSGFSTSGKAVVVPSYPLIDPLSSRSPTSASIVSGVNTPTAMDVALNQRPKSVDDPVLPSSPVSLHETMPEASSLQGLGCDDSSFIEKVTEVNTSKPTYSSRTATASRGATPRKLLPAVPVHLEVNKVIGHPSDVYPELFTRLLVGSYVADMDGISDAKNSKIENGKLPRWQALSLEEFFAATDKSRAIARTPRKNPISSAAQMCHLSRPKVVERFPLALVTKAEDQDRACSSRNESRKVQITNMSGATAKSLHLGDVVGMADFASAEISYEKTVDMLLAGTAIRSGFIQPTFSLLPRGRGVPAKEGPRRADAPVAVQEAPIEKCVTSPFEDATAVEKGRGDNLSQSSSPNRVSDDRVISPLQRDDRGSSCRSTGRLIKNVRCPLGNPEDQKALDVNERVPEASSHQTTQVDSAVMTTMFQVQRLGRPSRLRSCRRYKPDQYFDPSRPLQRPQEQREASVSFHDEESYCYYDDEVCDTETSQEGQHGKSKEYINIVFPFTSLIRSALQAHSKPNSVAPQPSRADGDSLSDYDADELQQSAGGRSSPASPDELHDGEDYVVHMRYSDSLVGDGLAPLDGAEVLVDSEAPANDEDATAAVSAAPVVAAAPETSALVPRGLRQPRSGLQVPIGVSMSERDNVTTSTAGLDGWRGGLRTRQPAKPGDEARAGLEKVLTATRFQSAERAAAKGGQIVALPAAGSRKGTSAIRRRSFALHRTSPSIPTPYGVASSADAVSVASVPRKVFIPELERAARSHTRSFEYLSQVNSLRDTADYRNRHGLEFQQQHSQQLEETLSVRPAFSRLTA